MFIKKYSKYKCNDYIYTTVVRHTKKANAQSSTFGFCRHAKSTLKNQKSLPFPYADPNRMIIYLLI